MEIANNMAGWGMRYPISQIIDNPKMLQFRKYLSPALAGVYLFQNFMLLLQKFMIILWKMHKHFSLTENPIGALNHEHIRYELMNETKYVHFTIARSLACEHAIPSSLNELKCAVNKAWLHRIFIKWSFCNGIFGAVIQFAFLAWKFDLSIWSEFHLITLYNWLKLNFVDIVMSATMTKILINSKPSGRKHSHKWKYALQQYLPNVFLIPKSSHQNDMHTK